MSDATPAPEGPRIPPEHLPFPLKVIQILTRPSLLLGATGLLSLALLGVGAAFLLPPPNLARDLPDESSLGTLATRSIHANRDYIVPDPAATEAQRRAAAANVRPVYDFDLAPLASKTAQLSEAFAYGRALVAEAAAQREARAKKRPKVEATAPPAVPTEGYPEFEKRLQAVVDERLYDTMAAQEFSPALERAATALVRAVLSVEVLPARELVLAERGRGITVRRVGAGGGAETERPEADRLADVASTVADLKRVGLGEALAPGSDAARLSLALPADTAPDVRQSAAALAAALVVPNLAYNAAETAARREGARFAVKPVVLQYGRGEKVVGDGERIDARHLLVFRHMRDQARTLDEVQIRVGAALFAMLLASSVFTLARRTLTRFRPGKRDLFFLSIAGVGNLALVRGVTALAEFVRDDAPWLTHEAATLVAPLTAGTLVVRALRSGESSVVFAFTFAPLVMLQTSSPIAASVGLVAALVAADRLGRREGALGTAVASIESGMAASVSTVAIAAFAGRPVNAEMGILAVAALVGATFVSPLVVTLSGPVFEALFGYTTEGRLARLANLNHPALKELIIRAPGTYHHSIVVGALAEAAAKAVGANPLLARVAGYYHDIGKAQAPLYFAENQKQDNPLERLAPGGAMEVLREHVSIGLSRGKDLHLPLVVLEVITQHHGTRVSVMFHERAVEEAAREGRPPPPEADFRYPGPKPRTREAGLVMLADAVEAASRSAGPSAEELRAMVPKVVQGIVLEGQLDDCDLTLAEVRRTIEAMQGAIVELADLPRVEPLHGQRGRDPNGGPVLRAIR